MLLILMVTLLNRLLKTAKLLFLNELFMKVFSVSLLIMTSRTSLKKWGEKVVNGYLNINEGLHEVGSGMGEWEPNRVSNLHRFYIQCTPVYPSVLS